MIIIMPISIHTKLFVCLNTGCCACGRQFDPRSWQIFVLALQMYVVIWAFVPMHCMFPDLSPHRKNSQQAPLSLQRVLIYLFIHKYINRNRDCLKSFLIFFFITQVLHHLEKIILMMLIRLHIKLKIKLQSNTELGNVRSNNCGIRALSQRAKHCSALQVFRIVYC